MKNPIKLPDDVEVLGRDTIHHPTRIDELTTMNDQNKEQEIRDIRLETLSSGMPLYLVNTRDLNMISTLAAIMQ
jgi:hypothetical protein